MNAVRERAPSGPAASGRPPGGQTTARLALLVLAASVAFSCRLYQLEHRLGPKYAEFYSEVQYIMTGEERKIFLELPDSERDAFIEDFWKRRNPIPDSAENAFKTEYEARVLRANQLFHGEGRAGYLTDRGRIYILFGPPMDRLAYPMDAGGYCREIWYYGAFPVIFVDEHCQGQYMLTAVNLEHLQALNMAQGHFEQTFEQAKRFFDYDVALVKERSGPDRYEGRVVVDIPYAGLWFDLKDDRLTTTLEVRVALRRASGAAVLDVRRSYDLGLSEDELRAKKDKSFRAEIPVILANDVARLRTERLALHVGVRNTAEEGELKKVVEVRLDR